MINYSVTSKSNAFKGELIFKFDDEYKLYAFEIQAVLTDDYRIRLLRALPLNKEHLEAWKKTSPTLLISEIPLDLSFETFYNKYGYKVGDKKRCMKLWNDMTDAQKTKALIAIPKYFKFLETSGTAKAYPERYLSKEYYNNEY